MKRKPAIESPGTSPEIKLPIQPGMRGALHVHTRRLGLVIGAGALVILGVPLLQLTLQREVGASVVLFVLWTAILLLFTSGLNEELEWARPRQQADDFLASPLQRLRQPPHDGLARTGLLNPMSVYVLVAATVPLLLRYGHFPATSLMVHYNIYCAVDLGIALLSYAAVGYLSQRAFRAHAGLRRLFRLLFIAGFLATVAEFLITNPIPLLRAMLGGPNVLIEGWTFGHDLYVAGLVLNTVLYISLRQVQREDHAIDGLVCAMGIQLAGLTATVALLHFIPWGSYRVGWIEPLCALGMVITWLYAVTLRPDGAVRPTGGYLDSRLAVQ